MILENRHDSILGAVAGLRLAQIDTRDGNVERASAKLATLIGRFDTGARRDGSSDAGDEPLMGVLARGAPEAGLRISLQGILLEAHRLRDLISANRDPLYGYEPISGPRRSVDGWWYGLSDLDPRHDRYEENLRRLRARYPNCQIEDNIDLEIAKGTAPLELRIERLEACLKRFPDRDAAMEGLLRLGLAYQANGEPDKAEEMFEQLIQRYPASIWAGRASRYVSWPARTRLTRAGP